MTDTLKPCPLCGGEAQLEDYRDGGSNGYGVFCQTFTCQTCGPTTLNALDAINLWNTRPVEDALQAEIARLRAALRHIGYQKPVSSVSLDWHEEWRTLRNEAQAALKGGD
jgi:hypothetical protein